MGTTGSICSRATPALQDKLHYICSWWPTVHEHKRNCCCKEITNQGQGSGTALRSDRTSRLLITAWHQLRSQAQWNQVLPGVSPIPKGMGTRRVWGFSHSPSSGDCWPAWPRSLLHRSPVPKAGQARPACSLKGTWESHHQKSLGDANKRCGLFVLFGFTWH